MNLTKFSLGSKAACLYCLLLLVIGMLLAAPLSAQVQSPCGNDDPYGPTAPCDCDTSPPEANGGSDQGGPPSASTGYAGPDQLGSGPSLASASLSEGVGGVNPINMYTGNVNRTVRDLLVDGSVGDYPLKWERMMTTRYRSTVDASLGDGGSWRHNYQWSITSGKKNNIVNFIINFPNGSEIEFRKNSTSDTYWRCYDVTLGTTPPPRAGVMEQVGVDSAGGSYAYILYLRDGGRVYFSDLNANPNDALWRASKVVDPHGLTTYLAYGSATSTELVQVTEPAGRKLFVTWYTWQPPGQSYSERLISRVDTSDGQSVVYTYGSYTSPAPESRLFSVMNTADYGDGTAAHYTYQVANRADGHGRPLPLSCDDPRYKGPMSRIKYDYTISDDIYGLIHSEKSLVTGTTIVTYDRINNAQRRETWGDGRVRTLTYDRFRLSTAPDFLGKTTSYIYSSGRYIGSRTDALNHTTTYEREANLGAITKVTYPDNTFTRVVYSNAAFPYFVAERYDELNRKTQYTRDARNNVTRIDYPDSEYETWTYNAFNQPLTHRQRNGGTENFAYDSRGLKTGWTDALGKVTTYAYDAHDRMASVTDPLNHATQYSRNLRGLLTGVTYADNSSTSFSYDTYGNQTGFTDELNHTWTKTYDEYNRLTDVKDPLNRTTSSSYGLLGGAGCGSCHTDSDVTRSTLPSGKYTTYAYDANHRRTSKTVGAGTSEAATTAYEYDDVGNRTKVTDPRQKVTLITYDARDRRSTTTDALGHTTTLAYDAVGNMTSVTRADNTGVAYEYNSVRRPTKITDALGQITLMAYDTAGRLQTLTDGRNNTYSFTYDLRDRKIGMIYPGGSHEDWSYDNAGRKATYTTRAGQVQTFSHDLRNRETLADWSDNTPDVSRSYDAAGRLLTLNNGVCNLTYTYDNADQRLSETAQVVETSLSKTTAYAYDLDGNKVTLTYPEGEKYVYAYTARNQMQSITPDGSSALVAYGYDLAGNRTSKDLENGTETLYAYDDANRLISLVNHLGGVPFATFDYGYNAVNNRTYVQRDGGSGDVYGYDAIDELTGVDYDVSNPNTASPGSQPAQKFIYDATGNRQTSRMGTVTTTYAVNNLNQYTQVGGVTQPYDANGNQTGPFQGLACTYDAQNRLVTMVGNDPTTPYQVSIQLSFAYDARNRCVLRKNRQYIPNYNYISASKTALFYDAWNLICEYSTYYAGGSTYEPTTDSYNASKNYVHGAKIDEVLTQCYAGSSSYYGQYFHQDALGSTICLTDYSGQVVERTEYDVYGQPMFEDAYGNFTGSSSYSNRFLFTGREWLDNLGVYDYRNRIYSPALGRFLQADPIRFRAKDQNLYRYVSNDPVNATDPLGLKKRFWGLTGGKCYNDTNTTQYWIDEGVWKPLEPGASTGILDDCDGMTCRGGFYYAGETEGISCNAPDKKECPMNKGRRWTPGAHDPGAIPPGPLDPGYNGPHRGGPVGNPPPNPNYPWAQF